MTPDAVRGAVSKLCISEEITFEVVVAGDGHGGHVGHCSGPSGRCVRRYGAGARGRAGLSPGMHSSPLVARTIAPGTHSSVAQRHCSGHGCRPSLLMLSLYSVFDWERAAHFPHQRISPNSSHESLEASL
jgi:hypothetical protein